MPSIQSPAADADETIGQPRRDIDAKKRSIPIDFLRGVAILLVIGHHSVVNANLSGHLRPFLKGWSTLGWTGVDLFFVISGFLIGGIIFAEIQKSNSLDVKRFIIRRGFRIWPLYFTYLILATGLAIKHQHSIKGGFLYTWTNWLHLQNYTIFGHSTPLYHTWSLAVEEHFYLFLPLLLLLALRGKKIVSVIPAIPATAAILAIGCLTLRCLHSGPFTPQSIQYPTHLRMDALFFGVLIAYLSRFHKSLYNTIAQRPLLLCLVGIALISPMAFINMQVRFVWTIGYTMLFVGYGLILMGLVSTAHSSAWNHPLIRVVKIIGMYSFGIYLFHIGFGRAAESYFIAHFHHGPAELQAIAAIAVFIVVAFVAGFIMEKTIGQYFLRLRDRVYAARA